MKLNVKTLMGAYDWEEAMEYAKFRFDQIEKVIMAIEGENDESDWLLLVELKGGGYGGLIAWCDYTGWSCQAGGSSGIFETIEQTHEWFKKQTNNDERIPLLKKLKKES